MPILVYSLTRFCICNHMCSEPRNCTYTNDFTIRYSSFRPSFQALQLGIKAHPSIINCTFLSLDYSPPKFSLPLLHQFFLLLQRKAYNNQKLAQLCASFQWHNFLMFIIMKIKGYQNNRHISIRLSWLS